MRRLWLRFLFLPHIRHIWPFRIWRHKAIRFDYDRAATDFLRYAQLIKEKCAPDDEPSMMLRNSFLENAWLWLWEDPVSVGDIT